MLATLFHACKKFGALIRIYVPVIILVAKCLYIICAYIGGRYLKAIMIKNFLKPSNVVIYSFRNYIKKYKWRNEGIKYPGFTYYPRSPDFKDPEYEPTKLFRVQRIKPVKGNPHWEKKILQVFQLDGKANDVAIVKNIPENNAMLWKIKHLIKISPVTFPNGMPSENDLNSTYLKENGELIIARSIKPMEDKLIATEKFTNNPVKLDGNTLRRNSRLKWNNAWSTSL